MNLLVARLLLFSCLLIKKCGAFNQRLSLFLKSNVESPDKSLGSWEESYNLAYAVVGQMTLSEKIGIVTGTGMLNSNRLSLTFWILVANHTEIGRCVGETTPVTRLGIPSLCFNDGPAGVRSTKGVTGFPTGINTASTFSHRLMRARGQALGEEFRGKGIK
jgi:beta-glucosidase